MTKASIKKYIDDNFASMIFGKVIKRIRLEKGLSGENLARMLNISQQQISRYERGDNKITVDTLMKLAFVLGISLDIVYRYFFEEIICYDVDGVFYKKIFLKNRLFDKT